MQVQGEGDEEEGEISDLELDCVGVNVGVRGWEGKGEREKEIDEITVMDKDDVGEREKESVKKNKRAKIERVDSGYLSMGD